MAEDVFPWRRLGRVWLLGRHDRKRLGRQPEQLGASKLVVVQYPGSRASKPVLAQVRWPRDVCQTFLDSFITFRWPTREAFVLRTDAAFAAMGAWEARSEVA